MENPEDLVTTLEGTVERLKVIFDANKGAAALNDDTSEVMQLCVSVECILRHQQKEKMSFWGERRDYWSYLSESVGDMKTLDGCVKIIQALLQLTTGQGKGRALIRGCLCEQLLAECVQHSVSNTKRTKEWYHSSSILLSPSLSQRVLNALYDLSEITFDLPNENIDLDETWPSFVVKSFHGRQSLSDGRNKSLLGVLGTSTKDATKVDIKTQPAMRHILERAVEEHATEIFVKQEIPFDLGLVGILLADIRTSLVDQEDVINPGKGGHGSLPELRITKMDDITSCLALLKDYVVSLSREVTSSNSTLVGELKILRERMSDLELQLKETILESESCESSLLVQLKDSRDSQKAWSEEVRYYSDENDALTLDINEARKKMVDLEALNFDLEEQLVRSDTPETGRKRAYTIMENSITEKDKEISDLANQLEEKQAEIKVLQAQVTELQINLDNKMRIQELHQKSETELKSTQERESTLQSKCKDLEDLNSRLESMRSDLEQELDTLKEKLELESKQSQSMKWERDQIRTELNSMHGLIENETASLRFQLSTQTIELQHAKEESVKKDKAISELQSRVANLRSQLGEANERCEETERQMEELKQELQDVESILSNNHDEMSSLNEQLTEKTLSRDKERSELLKLQNELDMTQTQLQTEKIKWSQQVEQLTTENNDIRRAFKRLLEQKVTLWQHADALEQEQIAMGEWIDDKTVLNCMACNTLFSLLSRKHHCRSCGKVFCSKCCEKKSKLPVSKDPVRVCDKCHERISHMRTPLAARLINNLDTESLLISQAIGVLPSISGESAATNTSTPDTVVKGSSQNGSASNSLNIGRSLELNGNSLQAKLYLQNSESTLSGIEIDSASVDGPSNLESSNLTGFDQESLKSVDSREYSVEPEAKQREAEKELQIKNEDSNEKNINFQISAIDGDTLDEGYYLIDTTPQGSVFPVGLDSPGSLQLDVNALASKLASIEVRRQEDEENESSRTFNSMGSGVPIMGKGGGLAATSEYTEVMLPGGGCHEVPLRVEKCGTALVWEFSTEPKGIAFGINYKERGQTMKEEEVLPLKRTMSHKATLAGEYVAQKAGIYILKFDNCHSKYSGRTLLYKVWMKPLL